MAEILHAAVAPYVVLYTEGLGGRDDSDGEHRRLLEACRAGDGETAFALLDAHIAGAATTLIEFLRTKEIDR